MKAVRPVRVEGDTVIVPLGMCQGGVRDLMAFADAKFAGEIGRSNWALLGTRSNLRYAKRSLVDPFLLHRLVWLLEYGYVPEKLDHIDRNGLNCRLRNLRPASVLENNRNCGRRADNTSGYKGVKRDPRYTRRPWYAAINNAINETLHLGSFATAEAAARAYDRAAMRLFGSFAVLNFPGECTSIVGVGAKLELLQNVRSLVTQNPNVSVNAAYQHILGELNKELLPLWRSERAAATQNHTARLKLLDEEIQRVRRMEK